VLLITAASAFVCGTALNTPETAEGYQWEGSSTTQARSANDEQTDAAVVECCCMLCCWAPLLLPCCAALHPIPQRLPKGINGKDPAPHRREQQVTRVHAHAQVLLHVCCAAGYRCLCLIVRLYSTIHGYKVSMIYQGVFTCRRAAWCLSQLVRSVRCRRGLALSGGTPQVVCCLGDGDKNPVNHIMAVVGEIRE
jgi:hypothetical protein